MFEGGVVTKEGGAWDFYIPTLGVRGEARSLMKKPTVTVVDILETLRKAP